MRNAGYETLYRTKIRTPTLHVLGSLDPVISPSDTLDLAKYCENATTFEFFGAHQIPRNDSHFPQILNDFVRHAFEQEDEDEGCWVDELD